MRTLNKEYVICITNLSPGRQVRGKLHWLTCSQELGAISEKFGISGRLKQALGKKWGISISRVFAAEAEPERYKHMSPSHTVVGIIKKIMEELSELNNTDCTTIIVPPNHPEKTDVTTSE